MASIAAAWRACSTEHAVFGPNPGPLLIEPGLWLRAILPAGLLPAFERQEHGAPQLHRVRFRQVALGLAERCDHEPAAADRERPQFGVDDLIAGGDASPGLLARVAKFSEAADAMTDSGPKLIFTNDLSS